MGFFEPKPKVSAEDFCKEFYDSQVFEAVIGGVNVVPQFWDAVRQELEAADPSVAKNDQALFQEELTALRMELFALAWMHKFKKDHYTIPQSIFAKRYLRGGLVCLNSAARFDKWNRAAVR